jgi:hypothetical protein
LVTADQGTQRPGGCGAAGAPHPAGRSGGGRRGIAAAVGIVLALVVVALQVGERRGPQGEHARLGHPLLDEAEHLLLIGEPGREDRHVVSGEPVARQRILGIPNHPIEEIGVREPLEHCG